jgi:hypothetical protein
VMFGTISPQEITICKISEKVCNRYVTSRYRHL